MTGKLKRVAMGVVLFGLALAPVSPLCAKSSSDTDDEATTLTFSLDGDFESSNDDVELQSDLYPSGESVYFTGKKLKTDKSLSVKVKKVDGEYELVLKESDSSSNYSGLKLSYNRKKGTVKGSFKVYGVQEYETKKGVTKMKLKKYSVKVTGEFDGTSGSGTASSKGLGTASFSLE